MKRFISRNYRLRHAFTLVELLVVIAIIGILVGLLLPAVQAAREAARRMVCMNNMAQLGLAIHHYEFDRGVLPPGVTNEKGPIRYEPIGNHVSWTVKILPYMEQQSLYTKFDQEAGVYATANLSLRKLRISSFLCPSNPNEFATFDDQELGLTHYAGCHNEIESPIDEGNFGVLYLNSKVKLSEISDGTSQTILASEKLAIQEKLGWASGARDTLRNTSGFEEIPKLVRGANSSDDYPIGTLSVGGFGSYHTGGINTVNVDGSVRFISRSIDLEIFRLLGNRADGEPVSDLNY